MSTVFAAKSLKPAPGYLLVEPAKQDKKTDSGIYLPDSHEDKPQYGKVLAVGDDLTTGDGTKLKAPAKKAISSSTKSGAAMKSKSTTSNTNSSNSKIF